MEAKHDGFDLTSKNDSYKHKKYIEIYPLSTKANLLSTEVFFISRSGQRFDVRQGHR